MDLEYKQNIFALKEAAIIFEIFANKFEDESAKAQAKESVKAVAWAAMELTKVNEAQKKKAEAARIKALKLSRCPINMSKLMTAELTKGA